MRFGGDTNIQCFDCGVGCMTVCVYVKTQRTVHRKVNSTICKLHLNKPSCKKLLMSGPNLDELNQTIRVRARTLLKSSLVILTCSQD